MTQTKAIIKTLKLLLRRQSVTYLDIAEALNLSEANIKHMFATNRLSLERLEVICGLINFEITDLMLEVSQREPKLSSLNLQQEELLISNPKLLLVAVAILNGMDEKDITNTYQINRTQCQHLLEKLSQFNLLKFHPNGSFKLLIERNFKWIPDGPIQKYFRENLQPDFLAGTFKENDEHLVFLPGILSTESRLDLVNKMQKLAEEFEGRNNEDSVLHHSEKRGSAMMLAIRPWHLNIFEEMRRK